MFHWFPLVAVGGFGSSKSLLAFRQVSLACESETWQWSYSAGVAKRDSYYPTISSVVSHHINSELSNVEVEKKTCQNNPKHVKACESMWKLWSSIERSLREPKIRGAWGSKRAARCSKLSWEMSENSGDVSPEWVRKEQLQVRGKLTAWGKRSWRERLNYDVLGSWAKLS